MDEAKVGVLGLCEVRWNQSGEIDTHNGKRFLYSGMPEEDDDHIHGVGILLSSQMKGSLLEWAAISERLMTARLKCKLMHQLKMQRWRERKLSTVNWKVSSREFQMQIKTWSTSWEGMELEL
jgi:hypothetical protein